MLRRCIAALLTFVVCLAPAGSLFLSAHADGPQPRDFANLVLFAYFRDEPDKDYFNAPAAQPGKSRAQALMELYDGQQGRSFRQYMNTISGGRFRVHNLFPQWDGQTLTACELPFTLQQARSGSIDAAILTELVRQLPALQGRTLDRDGDGCIDNLSVVLLGKADNLTDTLPSLYPHQNTLPAGLQYSGKAVANYNLLNTDRLLDSPRADGSGVICHEFLHTLGYPDLYAPDGAVPVGSWDIMASSSRYPSWPLAYLRAHFTGWCQLSELTASAQKVSLSAPGEAGNPACVIRSPRNPCEVFVVEMRRQASPQGGDTLDARIGGSGLIVYRVDTTVDGLSNYFGSTGVYVFRPQPGQNGYVEGSERATVGNAFLSAESGRTSIGSADPGAGLAQGALTFSDGTNSGIRISDVSSAQGGSMTFSVTLPKEDPQALRQDALFPAHTGAPLGRSHSTAHGAALPPRRTRPVDPPPPKPLAPAMFPAPRPFSFWPAWQVPAAALDCGSSSGTAHAPVFSSRSPFPGFSPLPGKSAAVRKPQKRREPVFGTCSRLFCRPAGQSGHHFLCIPAPADLQPGIFLWYNKNE